MTLKRCHCKRAHAMHAYACCSFVTCGGILTFVTHCIFSAMCCDWYVSAKRRNAVRTCLEMLLAKSVFVGWLLERSNRAVWATCLLTLRNEHG